jgi:amidase
MSVSAGLDSSVTWKDSGTHEDQRDKTVTHATAVDLAEEVRTGKRDPVDAVSASLVQIKLLDSKIGAFQVVRAERAMAEAEALTRDPNLPQLPLAGVPIAVKDNVAVVGEPMRDGSGATPDTPQRSDHEVVRRLRRAGAVVVGITRMSELGVWGMTDGVFGTARNPWDLGRTTGGSSGGSAAAVASAMVPIAHGNDGLGSIRIPSACCGLFGIKPGPDVVPAALGKTSWFGWAENGVLATTVRDAALVLSVMADNPELRDASAPDSGLRIGVSTTSPLVGVRLDPESEAAVDETARLLSDAGHHVSKAHLRYSTWNASGALWWYTATVADDAEGLDPRRLERRTRRHVELGRMGRRLGLVRDRPLKAWRGEAEKLFRSFDLIVTPTLLKTPPRGEGWHRRGWAANMVGQARYAPFAAWWNLARYPAASVPAGLHSEGVPIGIQIVGRPGSEALILSAAKLLEELRPWPRHAPLADAG